MLNLTQEAGTSLHRKMALSIRLTVWYWKNGDTVVPTSPVMTIDSKVSLARKKKRNLAWLFQAKCKASATFSVPKCAERRALPYVVSHWTASPFLLRRVSGQGRGKKINNQTCLMSSEPLRQTCYLPIQGIRRQGETKHAKAEIGVCYALNVTHFPE